MVTPKRIHTGEKLFQCQDCGNLFASSSYLIRHTLINTGEKPFYWQECGNLLPQAYLASHKLIHTDESPFKCEECGKSFYDCSNLTRLKTVHDREKPYNNSCYMLYLK